MKIIYHDSSGIKHWRTLTRLNVVKVARSIQKIHACHPISHLIGCLKSVLELHGNFDGDSVTLACKCQWVLTNPEGKQVKIDEDK